MKKAKSDDIKGIFGILGILAGGYVITRHVLPLLDRHRFLDPPHLDEKERESLYAYVSNPSGAILFEKTSTAWEPLHGYGREPLAGKLGFGKYAGKLTGISFRDLVQVRTRIDNKDLSFWMNKGDIQSSAETDFRNSGKSQSELRNIIDSLIDQFAS